MVLYNNIHIGATVEIIRITGELCSGKVKWKGIISGRKGDWIGLELFLPGGRHDGMVHNRRYFQCKKNHGLFVKPCQVRFSRKNVSVRSRDKYRRSVDFTNDGSSLGINWKNEDSSVCNFNRSVTLPSSAVNEISAILYDDGMGHKRRSYHRPHTVGSQLITAKCDQPKGGLSTHINLRSTTPGSRMSDPSYHYLHTKKYNENFFESPPSIPSRGWEGSGNTNSYYKHSLRTEQRNLTIKTF